MRHLRAWAAVLGMLLLTGVAGPGTLAVQAPPLRSDGARRLLDTGAYGEAVDAARAAVADLETVGQGDSLETAACLEVAATALFRLGKSGGDARTFAERALAIRRQLQGSDQPATATTMVVLADVLRARRETEAARELYEQALAIYRRTSGDASPEFATALNGLAGLAYNSGDLDAAGPLYRRALEIREAALPPDHPDLADSLGNLGTVERNLGDLDAARALFERAATIFESAFGAGHIRVANTLNNLALVLKASGDWSGARSASERALAIYERTLGPNHPYVAGMLNNLANLADKLGDEDQALRLLERSLEVRERTLGPEDPDVAQSLNNIGDLLRRQGDAVAARPLLERSLAIRERALGPDHPHVARTLSSLGELLVDTGDLAAGETAIGRALTIYETALGPSNPEVAAALNDLALVALARRQTRRAVALSNRAVSIFAEVAGESNPNWAEAALTLARAAAASGDRGRALDMALRSEDAARAHLQLTAPLLSDREALSYAGVRSRGRDLALQLLLEAGSSPDERRRVWEATVAARGVVLEALVARATAAEEARDPATAGLVAELNRSTETLARHLVAPPPGTLDEVRLRLAADRQRREVAERALAAASFAVGGRLGRQRPTLERVRSALPDGAALVSYVRYDRTAGRDDGPAYLAFVVRRGDGAPDVIDLGPAAAVDTLVRAWSTEVAADPEHGPRSPTESLLDYRRAGRALRRAVWDPLAESLRDASLILVVPDGTLHLVSFAALPHGRTGYLVEAGPPIHRLGAEREVLLLPTGVPQGHGLLALGGPELEALPALSAELEGSVAGLLAGRTFEPLPGAATEVEEIARTWAAVAGTAGSDALVLTGPRASESALKRFAPGRRTVHIATHGFTAAAPSPDGSSRGVGGLSDGPSLSAALLLEGSGDVAGLLLSPDPSDRQGGDDGVVTAPEITLLDLSSVEWTVLSACNTGRGPLHSSEGVLGLERAFRAAGARTVIVSLWAADDQATSEWMVALYHARLVDGASTAEAVRRAGLEALKRNRATGTSHPFTWGAFVATGDWR